MKTLLSGLGAIIITIAGGVGVWWLTTSPDSPLYMTPEPPRVAPTARPQSFMERLSGNYTLVSWNRDTSNLIDLAVRVKEGTLTIDNSGNADWDIGMWDSAASPSEPAATPSRTRCGGQVNGEQIRWVADGSRNVAMDWEPRVSGLYTDVWITFCGGVSAGGSAPFSLMLDEQSSGTSFLTMSNSEGAYRWRKN